MVQVPIVICEVAIVAMLGMLCLKAVVISKMSLMMICRVDCMMVSFVAFILLVRRLVVSSRVVLVLLMGVEVRSVQVGIVAVIPAKVLIVDVVVEMWNELVGVLMCIPVLLSSPVGIVPCLMMFEWVCISLHCLMVRVVRGLHTLV